jgi:hypothetical protein
MQLRLVVGSFEKRDYMHKPALIETGIANKACVLIASLNLFVHAYKGKKQELS